MGPLSRTEFLSLLERDRKGDRAARQALVESNTGLVHAIASRFSRPQDAEYQDIVQVGYMGLLKAIDGFDPAHGTMFATYAFPMITGEIRRYFREGQALKVARSVRDTGRLLAAVRESLGHRLGREPTVGELAEEAGVDRERAVEALDAAGPLESIDAAAVAGGACEPDGSETIVEKMSLRQAVGSLDRRERAVIALRYVAGMTQSAVARRLGVSQPQVSRDEKAALGRLRKLMT